MGGCVASASANSPSWSVSRRPSGSAMQRCAAPRLMCVVGASAPSIFWRALASASGLRVNWALMASARYSRLRLTPNASSWATIGARSQEMSHTTASTSRRGLGFRSPPLDPPPPGRPQHLLGPGLVGVPRDRHRDQRQRDAEPRKRVVVGLARRLEGVEVVEVVAPEAEPGEEDHEANHQPEGAPTVGFLLLKEVEGRLVGHALGLVERSTWGTARSAWSSISHRSAG